MTNAPTLAKRTLHPRALAFAVAAVLASGLANSAGVGDRTLLETSPIVTDTKRIVAHVRDALGVHVPLRTVVENCDDSGAGSLRDAYFHAVDGEELDLTQLTCSRITLTTGALTDGVANVSLFGPGSGLLTIDGSYANRVIVHNGSGNLRIEGLTITQGSYFGTYGGGCVYSYGDAYFVDVTVTGCSLGASGSTPMYGGALYVRGTTFLIQSTVSHSRVNAPSVTSGGGGIWSGDSLVAAYSTISDNMVVCDGSHYCRGGGVFAQGRAQIDASTVSGNVAETGAGIYHRGAQYEPYLLIQESTVSGNRASGAAGGVFTTKHALIADSTIAANTAYFPFGAGVYFATLQQVTLYGTIVADNRSEDGLYEADLAGTAGLIVAGSHNLVMASTITTPADTLTTDPLLGPLQFNGGNSHTLTHALLPGSPAIDHGINRGQGGQFVYDQRGEGFVRTIGADTDIGAYEVGADRIFSDGFDPEA
jgi:hypothetical protein